MAYVSESDRPLFTSLQYCIRCGMPSTEEGLTFDEMRICTLCRSSEQKMRISWKERDEALRDILSRYRGRDPRNYDCIVPISGGKDSAFQLYLLTHVYGMKPLAVTFSHNWFSPTGEYNLRWCLDTFRVDHVMFTPNRDVIGRIARRSLEMIGDSCWHCHAGVGAFPFQVAVRFGIPLLVWGESAAEMSGMADYEKLLECNRDYYATLSPRFEAPALVCDYLSEQDLTPFHMPSVEEIARVGVVGIHIGNYVFWDHERQMEFLRDRFGWREDHVEGTYKCYKSVECRMPGVHDFTKFLKRGFGRATDHVAQDVRAGLMTLEEGWGLIRENDPARPGALDEYLRITGYSEAQFYEIMDGHRRQIELAHGGPTRDEIEAALADSRETEVRARRDGR